MILPFVFPQGGIASQPQSQGDGQKDGIEIDGDGVGQLLAQHRGHLLAHIHLLPQAQIAPQQMLPVEKILDENGFVVTHGFPPCQQQRCVPPLLFDGR